jgi:hypothetical protein
VDRDGEKGEGEQKVRVLCLMSPDFERLLHAFFFVFALLGYIYFFCLDKRCL